MYNAQNSTLLLNAANTANTAFCKRNPEKVGNDKYFDANGIQNDISRGLVVLNGISKAQFAVAQALEIDFQSLANDIATSTNVKKVLRVSQFLGFITSGDSRYLKGSAKCALLAFAVTLCNAKNRAGIFQGLTRRAHTNAVGGGYDLPAIERATALVRALNGGNHMTPSTAPTQISVTYSKGGILPALGITDTMLRKGDTPDIIDSPVTRALIAMIENASDSTFDLWANKK